MHFVEKDPKHKREDFVKKLESIVTQLESSKVPAFT